MLKKHITKKVLALLLISIFLFAFSGCFFDFKVPPSQPPPNDEYDNEIIIIIDASANMLAVQENIDVNGLTRFEAAGSLAKQQGERAIADKKKVSLILAGQSAEYVVLKTDSSDVFNDALNLLECTFGTGDIDGALELAGYSKNNKQNDRITFYTATKYADADGINIVDVSNNEWNVAVLNVTTNWMDGFIVFAVEVASYNRDIGFCVYFEALAVNSTQETIKAQRMVSCAVNSSTIVYFEDLDIYSYGKIQVYIQEDDSFQYDNHFSLFGGIKEDINVLHVSTEQNNYIKSALISIQNRLSEQQKIVITESKLGEIALIGYDFYIFEHEMPQILPTDGVILLIDPDTAPENLGLVLGEKASVADGNFSLTAKEGQSSPIMNYINADSINVAEYTTVVSSDGYQPLIVTESGDPVFLVKDEPHTKIAVLLFSLNKLNSPFMQFPVLMDNLFKYFLPPMLTSYVYDVGESITLNARGDVLYVSGPEFNQAYDNFPCVFSVKTPGTYSLRQTLLSGLEVVDIFYVKISASQSNFCRIESLF